MELILIIVIVIIAIIIIAYRYPVCDLQCAKCCTKCCFCIIRYSYSHFTDEETESENKSFFHGDTIDKKVV